MNRRNFLRSLATAALAAAARIYPLAQTAITKSFEIARTETYRLGRGRLYTFSDILQRWEECDPSGHTQVLGLLWRFEPDGVQGFECEGSLPVDFEDGALSMTVAVEEIEHGEWSFWNDRWSFAVARTNDERPHI